MQYLNKKTNGRDSCRAISVLLKLSLVFFWIPLFFLDIPDCGHESGGEAEYLSPIIAFFAIGLKPQTITTRAMAR